MFASVKGKQQKWIRQLECQGRCIEHIPYYLTGLSISFSLEIAVNRNAGN